MLCICFVKSFRNTNHNVLSNLKKRLQNDIAFLENLMCSCTEDRAMAAKLQFNSLLYSLSIKIENMYLHKGQFPITIQAYEITGDKEFFIAEQMVNSQAEIETFSNKYAGKLIKAKALLTTKTTSTTSTGRHNRKSSAATIFIVILIILIILIAIGFYTGWIQRTTGITL